LGNTQKGERFCTIKPALLHLVKKLGNKAFGWDNNLFKNFDVIDQLQWAKKRKGLGDIGIGVLARAQRKLAAGSC